VMRVLDAPINSLNIASNAAKYISAKLPRVLRTALRNKALPLCLKKVGLCLDPFTEDPCALPHLLALFPRGYCNCRNRPSCISLPSMVQKGWFLAEIWSFVFLETCNTCRIITLIYNTSLSKVTFSASLGSSTVEISPSAIELIPNNQIPPFKPAPSSLLHRTAAIISPPAQRSL